MSAVLDQAGFTSVVATNCEQEYHRYLRHGEQVAVRSSLERDRAEADRAGRGLVRHHAEHLVRRDRAVASMMFRLLKFRPSAEPPQVAVPQVAVPQAEVPEAEAGPAGARDLPRPAAVIRAAAQGSAPGQYVMTSYYSGELGLPEMGVVARQLWRQAGLSPPDVRTAVLYDHFTPFVLLQLEELGFCPRGEARHFISGGTIELGCALPVNTHGGQLGEAYIHGMNGIAEGVRQVRGTSVNQVRGGEPVLVTAGTGVPTSALLLSGR
jgi:acetyl-CoA acetyltransferase